LWPVLAMVAVILPIRNVMPHRLYAVALAAAAGTICYLIAFLALGVKQRERELYTAKVRELVRARKTVRTGPRAVAAPIVTAE